MAERVTSISKAAGLSKPEFQVPPSDMPPPSPEALVPIAPGSPRVPEMTPVSSPLPMQSTPSISGAVEAMAPPRTAMYVVIAAITLAACVASVFVVRNLTRSERAAATATAPRSSAPAAMTVSTASHAASASAKPMRRVLVVEPRDAVVTVDGVRVPKGTQWLEGVTPVLLHAEIAGRVSRDMTVTFDTDDPLVVQLDPVTSQSQPAVQQVTVRPRATAASSPSSSATSTTPTATVNTTDVGY
jgi:hypothetical protein